MKKNGFKQERHVYRPPGGSRIMNGILIVAGGLLFTFMVFYVIPLMRKLEQGLAKDRQELVPDIVTEPPEEYEAIEEQEVVEDEQEEVPEMAENDQDFAIEGISVGVLRRS